MAASSRALPTGTLVAAAAVVLGLGALTAGTRHWIGRDRADLARQLAADRAARLFEATHGVEEDMLDIEGDLRFAAHVVQTTPSTRDSERLLSGMLGTVNPYHTVAVYERDGAVSFEVTDPLRPSAVTPAMRAALAEAAAAAAAHPDQTLAVSSELLASDGLWLRAFALPLRLLGGAHGGGAIAMLVDTHAFLARFGGIASDPHTQLLLLGPDGRPSPITAPALARAAGAPPAAAAGLARVLAGMAGGGSGTVTIDAAEAASLGLAAAEWISAYAPVHMQRTSPWAVATFTSLAALEEHEAGILGRVTTAAVVIALILLSFGAYVLVSSRRTAVLRERLRHADELQALQAQLIRAEKLTTVGVLAAGIAHEVGTPLGIVRGRAEYISGKLGAGHPHADGLQVIVDQIDRVVRVIKELLDFSGSRPVTVAAVDVAALVGKSLELLRWEAERRGLRLVARVPAGLPSLAADPDQLQQVLVNLVMNALAACAERGSVSIGAALEPGGARVRLEVSDDGCGIAPQSIHQVFDPFFTTKKRGQGTGLGLSVVTQIVRDHGAQIELRSEVGVGTQVVVRWPVAPAAVAELAS